MKTLVVHFRKFYTVSLGVLSLSLLTNCAPNNLIPENQRGLAPVDDSQSGWFVKLDSSEKISNFLENHPEAKARVVYLPNHSFEVFNVSENEIRSQLQPQLMFRNKVFKPNKISQLKIDRLLRKMDQHDDKRTLSPCLPNTDAPEAKIIVESPSDLDSNFLTETQSEISLASETSLVAQDSDLISAWAIETPEGSNLSAEVVIDRHLSFSPDVTGRYDVLLLVQNKNGGCNIKSLSFTATKNRPYSPAPHTQRRLAYALQNNNAFQLEDTKAYQARRYANGENVVVAVIDTGVNYLHPKLQKNIYINEKEIPNNQIDDDGNGFVDDYAGYDFANSDPYPYDDDGHGSHVSGLIASEQFGTAPQIKLMPLKAMGPLKGDIVSLYSAILYAVDNGADIINLSLGQYARQAHPLMEYAVDYADSHNVLVVAAAGNGNPSTGLSLNIENTPMFPAALPNDNILSVAAHSKTSPLTSYSNYGPISVDLSAPGGDQANPLLSTYKEVRSIEQYKRLQGTSMATPVVSGIAALVKSLRSDLSPREIKNILLSTGDLVEELQGKTLSGKKINALSAVQLLESNLAQR
ncbi:MAG: S8 family serine peptidase [Bdellovibrionales bacterium]|nr:S8 family serine peptidase [Bdellovibrionales bacterium]